MKSELNEIQHQLKKDIQFYKDILTESLRHQLIESIKANKREILTVIKSLSNKGEDLLTIYFVPEHIYKTTFVYDGIDAKFSLEHCINDYIYEDKFFTRKQVRYNIINFEKYYQELGSKVNLNELKLLKGILKDNPSIAINLKSYFESLGLSINIKKHDYFLAIDLSF